MVSLRTFPCDPHAAAPATDLHHTEAEGDTSHHSRPRLRRSIQEAIQQHASRTAAVLDEVGQVLPLSGQVREAAGNARDEQHEQDERVKKRVITGVLAVLSTYNEHSCDMIAPTEISRLWEAAAAQVPVEAARWGPVVIEPPYPVLRASFADL